MKLKLIIFVFMALFLNTHLSSAAENDYGIVQAWFNEKNATVEGLSMKIGEPATISVTVKSNISGNVYVKLIEPGFTKAYEVLSGPSKQDERIDNLNIESGWSKTFTWTIAPNGAWKNGNAPINIFVSFSKKGNQKPIQFTIANPFILDEQYPGSTPTQTTGAALAHRRFIRDAAGAVHGGGWRACGDAGIMDVEARKENVTFGAALYQVKRACIRKIQPVARHHDSIGIDIHSLGAF
ncbi:MAG: sarcinarray family MAST domain-containing protein [bacterium]